MSSPTYRKTTTATSITSTASQQSFVTAYETRNGSIAAVPAWQSSGRLAEGGTNDQGFWARFGHVQGFPSLPWPPSVWTRFRVTRRSNLRSSGAYNASRVGKAMAEATSNDPRIPGYLSDNITLSPQISLTNSTSPFPLPPSDPEPPETFCYSPTATDARPSLPVHEDDTQTLHEKHLIYNDKPSTYLPTKFKNIVLFGETGVGKSSLVNLMAGADVAETSSGLVPCTRQKREYSFTLPSQLLLRIIDTVGIDAFDSPIEALRSLPKTKDIDLALLCMKAGRFTASMQRTHYLISELLRHYRVPLAIVITHLEDEDVMEDWWKRNEQTFQMFGIYPVAHACVTALPSNEKSQVAKRAESRRSLETLFHDVLCAREISHTQALRNRLAKLAKRPVLFLMRRQRRNKLSRELEREYGFSHDEARGLAALIARG